MNTLTKERITNSYERKDHKCADTWDYCSNLQILLSVIPFFFIANWKHLTLKRCRLHQMIFRLKKEPVFRLLYLYTDQSEEKRNIATNEFRKTDSINVWSRYISSRDGPYINKTGKPSDQKGGNQSVFCVSLTDSTHRSAEKTRRECNQRFIHGLLYCESSNETTDQKIDPQKMSICSHGTAQNRFFGQPSILII